MAHDQLDSPVGEEDAVARPNVAGQSLVRDRGAPGVPGPATRSEREPGSSRQRKWLRDQVAEPDLRAGKVGHHGEVTPHLVADRAHDLRAGGAHGSSPRSGKTVARTRRITPRVSASERPSGRGTSENVTGTSPRTARSASSIQDSGRWSGSSASHISAKYRVHARGTTLAHWYPPPPVATHRPPAASWANSCRTAAASR